MSGEARRIVLGAALLDLAISPLFSWSVFAARFAGRLGVSDGAVTLVFSIGLACFTVGVLAGGFAADRVAPRTLALWTALGVVGGLGIAGLSSTLPALIAGFGVALGFATGVGYGTAVRVAGTVAGQRGLALGLVVCAYAAGTSILAPLAAWLLRIGTLGETFAVLAVTTGVLVLSSAALLPGGAPAQTASVRPETARLWRAPAGQSSTIVMLWIGFGCGSAPALTAFAHAAQAAGAATASALAVPLLSLGSLAGRLVSGVVSDRVGRPAALHATAVILAVACTVLGTVDQHVVRLAALSLLGVQYGALSTLVPAATAETVPASLFGAAYGTVFTGWGVAGLVVPVAAVAVAGSAGWQAVFLVFTGLAVLAWSALALAVRPTASATSANT